MLVYKITNLVNNKVYIGQTTKTLQSRKLRHIQDANNNVDTYFARAILKYGANSFKWQVICICPNMDSLNKTEQYYIAYYNSMDNTVGYNLQSGGKYCIMSDRTKEKLSRIRRGKNHPMYGKKHSLEARKKIKEAMRSRIEDPDYVPPMLGKKASKETLKKMSKASSGKNNYWYGKKLSKEHRKKLSIRKSGKNNPFYGKKHSEETRRKMTESQLKRYRKKNEQDNS